MLKSLTLTIVALCAAAGCASTANRTAANNQPEVRPCALQTASRIPVRPGDCSASPGRIYTGQDIDNTGRTDLATALRDLDPSVTIHH